MAGECALGASIAVSGVCLTVADRGESSLTFDAITETLQKSTLGSKRAGDRVNLERALQVGGRFDGHFVQGHVDGIATVDRVQSSSKEWVVWLRPVEGIVQYLIPKGSVSLDGVSLTIADVRGSLFSVALIPTTLKQTTLNALRQGDVLNVETDIITRTIVHRMAQMSQAGGLTIEALRDGGFA
jgi:riboflavin synthase